jgi:hypothetical protein
MSELSKTEKIFFDWELLAKKWLHSRKCVLYLVVLLVGSTFLVLKFINGAQWVDLVKWGTAGYMAANSVSNISDILGSKNGST